MNFNTALYKANIQKKLIYKQNIYIFFLNKGLKGCIKESLN